MSMAAVGYSHRPRGSKRGEAIWHDTMPYNEPLKGPVHTDQGPRRGHRHEVQTFRVAAYQSLSGAPYSL